MNTHVKLSRGDIVSVTGTVAYSPMGDDIAISVRGGTFYADRGAVELVCPALALDERVRHASGTEGVVKGTDGVSAWVRLSDGSGYATYPAADLLRIEPELEPEVEAAPPAPPAPVPSLEAIAEEIDF
jgi:hypothetical protein